MSAEIKAIRKYLQESFKGDLPGDVEQLKMAPYNRTARNIAKVVNPHPKESAVLFLIYPDNKERANFVLMQRTPHPGVHGAQISLPGGKKELQDTNLMHTALRETREELGIDSSSIEVLGELTSVYIPPSGFMVNPFVGITNQKLHFNPDKREVDYLIESPVSALLQPGIIQSKKIPIGLSKLKVNTPYFNIKNHVVWGATAMILSEFKAILSLYDK